MPAVLGLLILAAAATLAPDENAVAALEAWHRRYMAEALDLSPEAPPGDRKSSLGRLADLCDAATAADPAAAARVLLGVATRDFPPKKAAAIFRDPERLRRLRPLQVRDAARRALFDVRSFEATRALATALAGTRAEVGTVPARELAAEWLGATAAASGPVEPLRIYALVKALREDPAEGVRDAAARSLRTLGVKEAAPHLTCALASPRADASPRVRREAARALGALLAREHARAGGIDPDDGMLAALLDAVEGDGHALVRAAALDALLSAPSLRTVERLARFLASRPAGRSSAEFSSIGELLSRITGAFNDGTDPNAWLAWWEREKEKACVAPRPAGSSGPGAGPAPAYASRFYGIPIVGSRVVFVLDVSGSMAYRSRAGQSKIEEARAELDFAIRDLPESVSFNVVLFASRVHLWRRGFRRASPANKREAREYFAGKSANGATDLFGGLSSAFGSNRVGGERGPLGEVPDQIILLSDGQPSAGLLTDPSDIRLEVRRLNRDDAVRIDTVAIGDGAAILLDWLATENGGECVRIDPERARAEAAPRR